MAVVAGELQAILKGLGIKPTQAAMRSLSAWQQAEGGPDAFNPFNTTLAYGGSHATNSAGVQSYTSEQAGIAATIRTLKGNAAYAPIIRDLQKGDTKDFANAVGSSPWGTSGSLVAQILGQPYKPGAGNSPAPKGVNANEGGGLQFDKALFQKKVGAMLLARGQQIAQGGVPTAQASAGFLQDIEAARKAATTKVVQGGVSPGPGSGTGGLAIAGTGIGAKAVRLAASQIGTPYVWGGETAHKAFDCSGLVQYVYGKLGIKLPRTAAEQGAATHPIAYNQLKPGDLLMEKNGDHIVIYAGNGKVIQAPHTGTTVQSSPLSWFPASQYVARRV